MKPKHLRYDYMEAGLGCGENRHAQEVMEELGIKYQLSVPQSLGDQWWFFNCTNIPDKLPSYITILKVKPEKCIGFGLSERDVREIKRFGIKYKRFKYFKGRFTPAVLARRLLVWALKREGIWDKLDNLYMLGNIKSPTLIPLDEEPETTKMINWKDEYEHY